MPEATDSALQARALELLATLTGRPAAAFHDGQWEAIRALVADRRRALVVQRTGWGKSAVYFIATKLLREDGAGPTLLVSPLLALMRNQIAAAERMGVRAATVNSSNTDEWDEVVGALHGGAVDLLLVAPERLANRRFREEVLAAVGPTAGMLVIDEAHCISDWGHDFRPDYRRIVRVLDLLPPNVPVLACTATANDRVVADVVAQLGTDLLVQRGPLGRDGLALHVLDLPTPAERLAWLAAAVPTLAGTGIVYCLTVRDAEVVTGWLLANDIAAASYTGASFGREAIEQQLLGNDVKVVVATSALGMGFDKPDLAFVVHFQAPGTPVAYYQQVGRAGRQLERSTGVLLRGAEDADIQDWFIARAFPSAEEAEQVVDILETAADWVKLADLEAEVNVRPSRIELLMKNLEVDGAIETDGKRYRRTLAPWNYDAERTRTITALRREEQAQMLAYAHDVSCRMAFLRQRLDDPAPEPCGICDRCSGDSLALALPAALRGRAAAFLRSQPFVIEPRKQWADRTKIPEAERTAPGRALGRWGDGAWGDVVRESRRHHTPLGADLVEAAADLVRSWQPDPAPTWITWVPSARHPSPLAEAAAALGTALGLPVVDALAAAGTARPQAELDNSAQQHGNVAGTFTAKVALPGGPVLLLDDTVGSRWTLTEAGAVLRRAGCPVVVPLALADAGP